MGYVISHWRGEQSLLRSFWLNGVALRLVIYGLFATLIRENPVAIPLALGAAGVDLVILVWQCTGYFRAAERNLRGLGSMLPLWGGMFALIVAVFVVLTQWWGLALATHVPPDEVPYSVQRDQLHASNYDMRVSEDGTILTLRGVIALGATKRFMALLAKHPDLRHVHLTSNGGNIFEARGIAKLILAHELSTFVEQDCSSACTLPFIAGKMRGIALNARLGFHGYLLTNASQTPHIDVAAEQEKDRELFRARGVSDAFLEVMFQRSHAEIWTPDLCVLRAAGVVNTDAF